MQIDPIREHIWEKRDRVDQFRIARVLMVFGLLSTAYAEVRPQAFREIGWKPTAPADFLDRTVVRVRAVALNTNLFNASAASGFRTGMKRNPVIPHIVLMNFFPDASLRVRWTAVDRNEQGGIVWTGSVEGARSGQAVLILSGSSAVGNIARGDGRIYQIRTTDDGTVWLREVDQSRFPAEAKPK